MLGRSIPNGEVSANGLIAASQPAPWLFADKHPMANVFAAAKSPSRDFGSNIVAPPPDRITRALLNVIF
jgi:hypothetical protein